MKKTWRNKVIGSLLGVILLVIGLSWHTNAQTNLGDNWAIPINLSQSGTATWPELVVDGNGIAHLFWLDRFVGFVYTQNQDGFWQDPSPVLVPFSDPPFSLVSDTNTLGDGYSPTILADRSNLYGFWVNDEGGLAFSRTPIPNSIGSGEWSSTLSIADSIAAFDVAIDDLGRLYLAYVKRTGSNEFPTGVYYRFSDDAGITWAEPELLFQSDYLRSVEEESHVQIAVSTDNHAYIVWDNPLVEMVYLARSENRGRNWGSAELIDKRLPDDALESPGPGNIFVITQG